MNQHERHSGVIRYYDPPIVKDIKSQINSPEMQEVDYWLDDENILDIKPIHKTGVLVGVELIIGI